MTPLKGNASGGKALSEHRPDAVMVRAHHYQKQNPTATSIAAGLELLAVGFGKHVLHQVSGGPQAPRE
jgi:hypothetical protein